MSIWFQIVYFIFIIYCILFKNLAKSTTKSEREREREIKRMDEGNETTFRFMNGQSLANIKRIKLRTN